MQSCIRSPDLIYNDSLWDFHFFLQQVPTLNNVGLGMNAAELGPPGMPPSFKFVQDNTRQMIQQNSDYKVPQSGKEIV